MEQCNHEKNATTFNGGQPQPYGQPQPNPYSGQPQPYGQPQPNPYGVQPQGGQPAVVAVVGQPMVYNYLGQPNPYGVQPQGGQPAVVAVVAQPMVDNSIPGDGCCPTISFCCKVTCAIICLIGGVLLGLLIWYIHSQADWRERCTEAGRSDCN